MRTLAGDTVGWRSSAGSWWRVAVFYLRSRRFGQSLLSILACLAVVWWLGDVPLPKDRAQELAMARDQALLIHALAAFVAGVIGVAVWSPFGEPECISPVALPLLRLGHVLLLLAVALAGAIALVGGWHEVEPGVDPMLLVARNTVCLLGMALLGAKALHARVAWIPPVTLTGVTVVSVLRVAADMQAPVDIWTMPEWNPLGRPVADGTAMAESVVVGLVGLALHCQGGARDAGDEAE